MDHVTGWAATHPLQCLCAMVAIAVLAGLVAARRDIAEQLNRHHPRC